MKKEDKARFDAYRAGLAGMGLTLEFEGAGLVKSWILRGSGRAIARIFYEESKPYAERFSFMSVRGRSES